MSKCFLFISLLMVGLQGIARAETTSLDLDAMRPTIEEVRTAIAAQQWVRAEAGLRIILTAMPDSLDYYVWMGNVLDHLDRAEEALSILEKGLQMSSDPSIPRDSAQKGISVAQIYNQEGLIFQRQGQTEKAVTVFKKAVQIHPQSEDANRNLCALYVSVGKMKEAVPVCTSATQLNSSDSESYYLKASALYSSGMEDDQGNYKVPAGTAAALKKYLELAPQGPHAADVQTMLKAVTRPSH